MVDPGHLIVFFDHSLHYCIYLILLSDILLISLLSKSVSFFDLLLNRSLVGLELFELGLIGFALIDIIYLLVLQHDHVDGCILLL